jgi:glycosyltransferase involved in cell wall biosynthesis
MEEKTPRKILIIADGRSPITRRWIAMLRPLGYMLSLVSSYPCDPVPGISRLYILPLAFSQFSGSQAGGDNKSKSRNPIKYARPLAQKLRHWLGPWTLELKKNELHQIIAQEKPDLVHAMRIPFEGMLAGCVETPIPLVISTWGNDFTLHAPSTGRMGALTRQAMSRAAALLSDTQIDIQRAVEWGFDSRKPSLVVPGNGGINYSEMQAVVKRVVRESPPRVINPRGLRSYIHTDTFFKAIPLVLKEMPEVRFSCTSMKDQPVAENWVHTLGIDANVTLLPLLSQELLWQEFARSQVSVSVSSHDGTPNTLLEAMTLGCLPICGDLPSIREWISHGENGLLIDPTDPQALADAILLALRDSGLQQRASRQNRQIIKDRADISQVQESIKDFYSLIISKAKP